mgnify:CR=1 FL=1
MTEEQQKEESRTQENLAKTEELIHSAAFRWFMGNIVGKNRDEAERILHDLTATKDDREIAAHVSAALKKVADAPTEYRLVFRKALGMTE